jgi:uncharacterized membrane protein HdeD (DUF308 family)
MVILPRLARALNQPAIAGILGLLLVAVAIVGMATDDVSTRFGVIILVIGIINVIRTFGGRGEATEV